MYVVRKKLLLSFFFGFVAILSCFSQINHAIGKSFLGKFDKAAEEYLDESLKRALYTFAVARGVNGVISVVQNTAVSVSPAGVGVSLAAGEILDPVNDLVERFSWVMLVSSTSLGIQKIMSSLGKWIGFDILLAFSMVVLCIGVWLPRIRSFDLRVFGIKLALVAFAVRFFVPVAGFAGNKVYDLFLKSEYDRASQNLGAMSEKLRESEIVAGEKLDKKEEAGFIDGIKDYYGDAKRALALKEKIEGLQQGMSEYADYIIDLIVVFTLQTVVLPLVFLWLLVRTIACVAGKKIALPNNIMAQPSKNP